MPQTITDSVSSIRYYNCGYCVNELALVYRRRKPERRRFPSGAFLIKHPTKGYALFDTGYSMDIYACGPVGRLYRSLNPTRVTSQDEILTQLQADGIGTEEIKYIVLSHLHPDHVGGVKFFPDAKIVVSEGTHQTYRRATFRDLVLNSLLPDWFEDHLVPLNKQQLLSAGDQHVRGYDLFGDGSLILTSLEGHTHGQLGAYVPDKLLLAADACWGGDLMNHSRNMRALASRINHNTVAFRQTLDRLEALQTKGIRVYFSHDAHVPRELLK